MSTRLAARAAGPIPLAQFWERPAPPKRRKLEPLVERRQPSRRRSTPIPAHELPTRDEVMRTVSYCRETGVFTRKHRDDVRPEVNTRYAGKPAGGACGNGYVYVRVGGRPFLAHRLVALIVEGEWPPAEIDHSDGNPLNNSWSNLRHATRAQQAQNTRKMVRATSSRYLGVSFDKRRGMWRATIKINGRSIYLGGYPTEEEAHAAYLARKAELHEFQPAPRPGATLLLPKKRKPRKRAAAPQQLEFALAA